MKVPDKKEWQQDWTKDEVFEIEQIAGTLENECSLDDASLWMSAENEFSTGKFGNREL